MDPGKLGRRRVYHRKEYQKSLGLMSRILYLVNMGLRYGSSKGVREHRQEDRSIGNLAATCHLEESASRQVIIH